MARDAKDAAFPWRELADGVDRVSEAGARSYASEHQARGRRARLRAPAAGATEAASVVQGQPSNELGAPRQTSAAVPPEVDHA